MNWKRNSNLTIGLAAALFIAIVIIVFMYSRKGDSSPQPVAQGPPPAAAPQPVPQPTPQPPSRKAAIVLFHADWCGGCQQFMPIWKQVEHILGGQDFIEAISLEHASHKDEMSAQQIKAFPTIRLYIDGYPGNNYVEYEGDRSLDSVMKFIQSKGQQS